MRAKIEVLYSTHNSAKLPEVDHLVKKYGAAYLLAMMQQKYEGAAAPPATSAAAAAAEAPASVYGAVAAPAPDGSGGGSNKRISLVFFTRPCAETCVQCLPGCEDEDAPASDEQAEAGAGAVGEGGRRFARFARFAPILAADYRKVADDKRDALDGTGKGGGAAQ